MPEFFEKSPLSGAGKHPDFQVTAWSSIMTLNMSFLLRRLLTSADFSNAPQSIVQSVKESWSLINIRLPAKIV
jgi:hypothetical protein